MTNYQALVNQYIAEHPSAGAEWGQIALQDFARWADDRRSHEPEKASVTNQNDGMQVGGGGFDLLSRLGHGDDLHKQARAEIEHLREVLTIPNITPDTTSSALFIRTLSEHEKGQPVNGQDLINALMWRVKNQRKEIARLQEKRRSPEPLEQRLRTPQGEPALTHVDGLPGTREPVLQQPQGNAGESPALFNCGYDPTSHGWVIREGSREGVLVACFLREEDANSYVIPAYALKSETVEDSCGPGCAMGANRPAQKSDEIRDLACCDKFVRESASEFCATCGYTNLDHLRKRSSSRTGE